MLTDATVAGNPQQLLDRVQAAEVLTRWQEFDPSLADVAFLDARSGPCPDWSAARRKALIAALVHLGCAQGRADNDALLLAVHLLSRQVARECRSLRDLSPRIIDDVASELCCAIRSYPWDRRPGLVVSNLMLDTRRNVLDGYLGWQRRRHTNPTSVAEGGDVVDVLLADEALHAACASTPGPEHADVDVVGLLTHALAYGAEPAGVRQLIETEVARDTRQDGHCVLDEVAGRHGISKRNLCRSRERTLAAVRASAPDYLGWAV